MRGMKTAVSGNIRSSLPDVFTGRTGRIVIVGDSAVNYANQLRELYVIYQAVRLTADGYPPEPRNSKHFPRNTFHARSARPLLGVKLTEKPSLAMRAAMRAVLDFSYRVR